jgi:hypothetical protein
MYFSVFQSSEYNADEQDEIIKIKTTNNEEIDNCIICWHPGDNYKKLYILTEIPNIILGCDCEPKIHQDCLNEWLKNTPSCPICRKKIGVNIHLRMRLKISLCISRYIQCLFTIYFCILGINLLIILIDQILIIYDNDFNPQGQERGQGQGQGQEQEQE